MRPIERTVPRVAAVLLFAAVLWPAQPVLAQFTQQGPRLVGSGAAGNANQGFSVALSADGNTAIIGGPSDNGSPGSPPLGIGATWVFTRSGGVWTQQGSKLLGSGLERGLSNQGASVALSADGNTAIVGGPTDSLGDVGAAWVFTRSGGVWTQQGNKLVGTGAAGPFGPRQGWSVALSADGNTAIVGAPLDNCCDMSGNNGVGAAWVFTRSGGVWSQQGNKLVAGSFAVGSANQGWSVALSADGNTAIVGAPNDSGGAGAAFVFNRSGGVWSLNIKLFAFNPAGNAAFGHSVALSADGNTAVVGGPLDNSGAGAAWVFVGSFGGGWSQRAKLVGTGAAGNAGQGTSVALSGNGKTAVVGGSGDNGGVGAAWVFTGSFDEAWTQHGNKLVGTGAVGNAGQGTSVALSCNTAVVGGDGDDTNGAAWVFVAPRPHDFNGDCTSDILWWNSSSGQVVSWLVNGTSVIGGGSPGTAPPPWAIVGQRDFNGDGYADILWRNGATGQVVIWLMNGTSIIGGGSPGTVTTDWTIAGTGDFNGDGYGDILWYNTSTGQGDSGQVLIWLMNGSLVIGGGSPGSVPSPWTIAGTGDFNGDGHADIVWYNTSTGQAVIWLLNGVTLIGGGSPGGAANPWTIAGTGDFNGDGMSDILWYNTASGQVVLWLVSGTSVIGGGSPGSAASPWTIAQTGDFNADGKSDILWVNPASGQLVTWFLNGTSVIGGGSPGGAASPWVVQGMNAD
jgi:hypothetical protein